MAQNSGLFGGIPFDTRTEEQILADKTAARGQRIMDRVQSIGYQHPSEKLAAQVGATIGRVIANRFAPPSLTEQEKARADAIARANERTKEYRSSHADVDPEELALNSQKFLVEELLHAGDPQALDMAQAYGEARRLKRRGQLELARLDTGNRIAEEQLASTIWDRENKEWKWNRGELVTVWQPGDEDALGRDAFIREEDGAAVFGDGTVIPLGQYTSHPPARTSGRELTLNEMGIGTIEQREARNHMNFVSTAMRAAVTMKRALQDAVQTTGSVDILANSGALASWTANAIDTLVGAGRLIGNAMPGVFEGRNLSDPGVARSYLQQNPALDQQLQDVMPEYIRNISTQAERWKAAMVQLAYARGMAAESGARNLSDQDFQNQVVGIGGATNSPEAFRQIMLGNIENDINAFNDRFMTFQPEVREKLFSKDRIDMWEQQKNTFMEEFSQPFGNPGAPGPGLAPTRTDESDSEFIDRILSGAAPAANGDDDGFIVDIVEED